MRLVPVTVLAAAATTAVAFPLVAQQASLRVGGLRAEYADSLFSSAGSLGGRLSWQRPKSRGVMDASWAQFDTGDGAGQAWLSLINLATAGRRTALGVRTDGSANVMQNGPWAGIGSLEAFAALAAGRRWTFSAGASGGGVRSFDATSSWLAGAALRSRFDWRTLSINAALTGTAAGATRYADATLGADWAPGRFSAGGFVATRRGDLADRPWGQGYASFQVTAVIALEAAAGSYPRDLLGFQRGRYVNAGLRIRLDKPRQGAMAAAAELPAVDNAPRLTIEPQGENETRLVVTAPGAESLAITGSWNEWQPLAMTPAGADRWAVTLPVGPGTYRFAIILGDGRWIVPAGVVKLPDDFGGEVGILTILP